MSSAQPNRLSREKSPYLLQHARNPVDWYPWGQEAFDKARRDQKPIFLSIGYSTCHWCHVMERESFESPLLAAYLNDHFVAIKVDREERPDIDHLYMQAVTQMTGQGGWPLTAFLTPDLKPFFGGTYFPPEDRWGRPGLMSVLQGVIEAWSTRRAEIDAAGQAMAESLSVQVRSAGGSATVLDEGILAAAYRQLAASFDEEQGGFDPAPKFPRPHTLSFLLRYAARTRESHATTMVERTLDAMAAGGIHDQLGGGFHRYSTDAFWRIPHFEKMLYDQALLIRAYVEAYQVTQKESHADTVRRTVDYLLREMTSPEGAFYSAEDADSEGEEGAYYLWTVEELERCLGKETAPIIARFYGVERSGNAIHDPTGELKSRNVLYRAQGACDAATIGLLRRSNETLLRVRSQRPRPYRDDKILTDWNGLMIGSLAFAAQVFDNPRWLEAAEKAADFLIQKMRRSDGRLLHRAREGQVDIPGMLDDYAFLASGLMDLYEATARQSHLDAARALTDEMITLFWDAQGFGFWIASADTPFLISRQKEWYDGAVPSGNSVAMMNLLRLGRWTGEARYEEMARAALTGFSAQLIRMPSAYPQLLIGVDFMLGPSFEIVFAGDPADAQSKDLRRALSSCFVPNKVVAFAGAPVAVGKEPVAGRPAAYVCRGGACQLPATDPEQFLKELNV